MRVRPGAVVRGAGVAAACLVPDPSRRSSVLLAGFAGGWFLNRPGLQAFAVVPHGDEPWRSGRVRFVRSVSSWSAVMLAATTALRRTSLPTPVAALVLGGGFVVIDSLLADLGEARAAATAAKADAEAETDETEV